MAIPLLAFMGLGFGGKTIFDEYTGMQAKRYGGRVSELIGQPPSELMGPSEAQNQGRPLMSPGTGLMGGEINPMQFAGELTSMPRRYQAAGLAMIRDQMMPRSRYPMQTVQSGAGPGGKMNQTMRLGPDGRAYPIPGVQPRAPGSAVTINQAAKSLTVNDIKSFTDRNGQNPEWAIGMTSREMVADPRWQQGGYSMQSAAGEKQTSQQSRAMGIVDQLEKMYFGEDGESGVYGDYGAWTESLDLDSTGLEGMIEKGVETVRASYENWAQDNPAYREAISFAKGSLSPLAKSLGEAGALATEDVERVGEGLLPVLYGTNIDKPENAKRKIKQLRALIMKGEKFLQDKNPGDTWIEGDWEYRMIQDRKIVKRKY